MRRLSLLDCQPSQVMVGVHFFIVAYNTDQIEQNGGVGVAWVAEIVLAGETVKC